MKIKQSTFYALRLIYRTYAEDAVVITSVELAEKEKISQGVTMKILRELARAGMMEVHQGRGQICGGFSLAKGIDKITLFDVIMVFEGLDICEKIGEPFFKEKDGLTRMCIQINEQLKEIFLKYTIQDLFESSENLSFERERTPVINAFQVVI